MNDINPAYSFLTLTVDIVAAHVAHNRVAASELPLLIQTVHGALSGLGAVVEPAAQPKSRGAVGVRASIKPDRLLSMIDGKPYSMLRRHIAQHGYTPESYREAFGLPVDYPMVAANYAERRRELAVQIGLGRKPVVRNRQPPEPADAPQREKLSPKLD